MPLARGPLRRRSEIGLFPIVVKVYVLFWREDRGR